ncbi:endonuclease/exonuclease/phosphatase family protein [Streptomyces sp. JJ38]|uniref:endonuclease/exonuclease/phosphatase family protein n=1 Tax=Streptomyces sp. JJ38 TaxID=2738128 RepID=UPI001C576128|nr:endonuclease/exonuclease/phosphatase family protein [Streptomyces sp. JJ38]
MTFNIRHGEGSDGVLDLERIAMVIESANADIVGLQEVDRHFGARSDWQDQAARLAEILDLDLAYGVNVDLVPPTPGGRRAQFGTALLSRHPITCWDNTHLVCSPGEEQRGLLHAQIAVDGVVLHVYNTHLDAFSEPDRAQQAKQVVELVGDTRPAVLLGDFNAAPLTSEIATLRAGFTDAWTASGSGEIPTFPAAAPDVCIDYVFAGPGVEPVWTGVVTRDLLASDHVPVLSRLAVVAPVGEQPLARGA